MFVQAFEQINEGISYIYFFYFISLLADIFKHVLCLNVKFLLPPIIIFIFYFGFNEPYIYKDFSR